MSLPIKWSNFWIIIGIVVACVGLALLISFLINCGDRQAVSSSHDELVVVEARGGVLAPALGAWGQIADRGGCDRLPDGMSCDDGYWCNGFEQCISGWCVSGESPCETPCDEMHRTCAAECVFDEDCDDNIWCNGQEWCCTWENSDLHCEKYHCYDGPGPCGTPIWGVLTVCDCEFDLPCLDTCRPCREDVECDDGCWCNGRERCGREDEGRHWGICLHAVGSRPCGDDEVCQEEWMRCEPRIEPECRRDSDCEGLEVYCDENGKCQNF
jgi:hypothetical protein